MLAAIRGGATVGAARVGAAGTDRAEAPRPDRRHCPGSATSATGVGEHTAFDISSEKDTDAPTHRLNWAST